MMNEDWQVVDTYSRKQAIADGVQVRIPDQVREEAGIKVPVFVSERVWERYIKVPAGMTHQDIEGRIWDILNMMKLGAKRLKSRRFKFTVNVQMALLDLQWNEKYAGSSKTLRAVELIAEIGAMDFDDPAPVITIFTQFDN